MNALPFVIAAYTAAALCIGGVLLWSWVSMRRAEKAADALRGERR
ncbi:heme exporter protein CcmD [Sphingosinicella soli]|uniref:Heme exporter protein D n=1 Tax=Sphingosinicella soli TaxID=333708 RepID=A0A7W7B1Q9_9SPHN|nr:heme exporter protein CcmD [Sphingosinicella soli]MBB4632425.1 heme exporter protein CcmD [Sphingosinicella soli]